MRVFKIVAVQPEHIAAGDEERFRLHIDHPYLGALGNWIDDILKIERHKHPFLDRDHGSIAVFQDKLGGAETEVAGIFHVERNRVGAAQFIADVFSHDRRLDIQLFQLFLNLVFEDLAEVDFRQADIVVGVALHIHEHFQVGRIEVFHQPFRQDHHPVFPAIAQALDDSADQNVDDML